MHNRIRNNPFSAYTRQMFTIENAKVGDEVTVHFLLKGREWKNPQGEIKFFNSLDVFRVETSKTGEAKQMPRSQVSKTKPLFLHPMMICRFN